MFRAKWLAFLGLLALLSTGCILSVEPRSAVNPVGTEHTVTVELIDPDEITPEDVCGAFSEAIEELDPEDYSEEAISFVLFLFSTVCEEESQDNIVGTADHNFANFEIIAGPNAGLNSDEDGVCEPTCIDYMENDEVSWTYQSNGVAGTDEIRFCVESGLPDLEDMPGEDLPDAEILEEIEEILLLIANLTLGIQHESVEDFFCQTVEKTWEAPARPQRPNIGAGLSGLFQGQPTPLPTAAAPAAATSPVIRPPSTGDAALR